MLFRRCLSNFIKVVPDTEFFLGDTDTETVSRLVDTPKVSLLKQKVSFVHSTPKNYRSRPSHKTASIQARPKLYLDTLPNLEFHYIRHLSLLQYSELVVPFPEFNPA